MSGTNEQFEDGARGGIDSAFDLSGPPHSVDSWLLSVIFCLIEALPQRVVRLLAVVALILLAGLHAALGGIFADKTVTVPVSRAARLLLSGGVPTVGGNPAFRFSRGRGTRMGIRS
jgi:hypothetical protein